MMQGGIGNIGTGTENQDAKANLDIRTKQRKRSMRMSDMLGQGDTLDYTVVKAIHKVLQEPPKLELVESVNEEDVNDLKYGLPKLEELFEPICLAVFPFRFAYYADSLISTTPT